MSIIFGADSCSDKEMKIVDSGPIAIMNVLFSENYVEKERLLFYLSHYLDPFKDFDMERKLEILDVLQYSLLSETNYTIQYALFHLLYKHCSQRLLILEDNLDLLHVNITNDSLRNSTILLIQFHFTISKILNE